MNMLRLPILDSFSRAGLLVPAAGSQRRSCGRNSRKKWTGLRRQKSCRSWPTPNFSDIQDAIEGGQRGGSRRHRKASGRGSARRTRSTRRKVKNPEDHPDGYRQLQISVRQSLRRIDDIMSGFPATSSRVFAMQETGWTTWTAIAAHVVPARGRMRAPASDPPPAAPKP